MQLRTLACALLATAAAVVADIVTLTTSNFDDVTQVTTGATGDWFVAFYSPSCPHYKALVPLFEQVSRKVDGKNVHLAWVDGKMHPSLKDRFRVVRSPTMLFFHNGRMYSYKSQRTVDDMAAFITTGFAVRDREMPHFRFFDPVPPANSTKPAAAHLSVEGAAVATMASIPAASKEDL